MTTHSRSQEHRKGNGKPVVGREVLTPPAPVFPPSGANDIHEQPAVARDEALSAASVAEPGPAAKLNVTLEFKPDFELDGEPPPVWVIEEVHRHFEILAGGVFELETAAEAAAHEVSYDHLFAFSSATRQSPSTTPPEPPLSSPRHGEGPRASRSAWESCFDGDIDIQEEAAPELTAWVEAVKTGLEKLHDLIEADASRREANGVRRRPYQGQIAVRYRPRFLRHLVRAVDVDLVVEEDEVRPEEAS